MEKQRLISNKRPLYLLWLFLVMAFTSYTVFFQENDRNIGIEIKLKLRPVDPVDIFRGRYLVLNYQVESKNIFYPDSSNLSHAFATFKKDSTGFWVIDTLYPKADLCTEPYLKVETPYRKGIHSFDKIFHTPIIMPVKKYFLNEDRAVTAEQEMGWRQSDSIDDYMVARCKNGMLYPQYLMIDGKKY